jgi:ADP-ribose pyrophosphatase YjhB (NUDIX family)
VLFHEGKVVLIRRGKEPLRGRWTIPGGTVELGEGLDEALVREMLEETGLVVRPLEMLLAFDRIFREGSEVRYHYVILDYLCEYTGGEARAGSDAEAIALVSVDELQPYDLPDKALEVIQAGLDCLSKRGLAPVARKA